MAKSPHISRAKMESILARGESVQYRGRIIVDPALLPSAAELAQGDEKAREEVLLNLDRQQQELDQQRRMLQYDELRDQQKPGPLDAQLANDPQEARRHPPRETPADPDARLRAAYDVARETGYDRSFHDFKGDYEKRVAAVKADNEAKAKEAEKAKPEPQTSEHPKEGDLTQEQVVERENKAIEEGKEDEPKPGDPPPGEKKKGHGHR